jgi:hypothetical protein
MLFFGYWTSLSPRLLGPRTKSAQEVKTEEPCSSRERTFLNALRLGLSRADAFGGFPPVTQGVDQRDELVTSRGQIVLDA